MLDGCDERELDALPGKNPGRDVAHGRMDTFIKTHAVDGLLEPPEQATVSRARAERAVRELLVALGRDVGEEGLRDTPRRVAAAFAELLTREPVALTTFPNEAGYDELVVVKAIPFHSLCMHHLLPFHGVAHVAYLPGERIVGLSKLARVVEAFARDLQSTWRLQGPTPI